MRKSICAAPLVVTFLALLLSHSGSNRQIPTVLAAQNPMPSACIPPSQIGTSPEETAWQLFVASTCPVNASQYPYVVWENWIEQSQLYGAGAAQALPANEFQRLERKFFSELFTKRFGQVRHRIPTRDAAGVKPFKQLRDAIHRLMPLCELNFQFIASQGFDIGQHGSISQ